MRLEQKREEETAKRKGSTGKTIIQFIWLFISFAVAYFAIDYIFNAGYISYNMIYGVGIPRSIPTIVIKGILMLFIVVAMQFFIFVGFMLATPEGRRRTGDPSMKSGDRNPYDYKRD